MCENSQTITRQKVEERVLSCLQSKLMAPERVNAFMAKVQQQIKAVRSESAAKHSHLKKRLVEAEKSLENMLDMVESGGAPATILDRIRGREVEIAALKAELAAAMPDSNVIDMMPDLAKVYERKVEELSAALNDPAVKTKATEVTPYDEAHFITYLRVLDAAAENADWREVARIVLHRNPDAEPERSRRCWESHLSRAQWMTKTGYSHLLVRQ